MSTDISIMQTDIRGYENEMRELLREYFVSANEQGREWFENDEFGAEIEEIVTADLDRLASSAITEPLFLALSDDRIVGSVQLKRLDETTVEVKRLYVKPAYRGEGIGRTLMDAIIAESVPVGFDSLRLGVAPYHEKAQSLYHKLGFEFTEPYEQTQAPTEIQDDWCFMKLSLSTS